MMNTYKDAILQSKIQHIEVSDLEKGKDKLNILLKNDNL